MAFDALTPTSLRALNTQFSGIYQSAYDAATPFYEGFTTRAPDKIVTVMCGPMYHSAPNAYGLVAAKGDTLKLAYSLDKEKQPTDFSGKHGFAFEMKKSSAKRWHRCATRWSSPPSSALRAG